MTKSRYRFQSLLNRKFYYQNKFAVDIVAKAMGVSSSTLYKWIEGANDMSVDYLLPYMKSTKDYSYLKYMARECGFQIVPKVNKKMVAQLISEMARILAALVDSNGDEEEE